MGQGLSVLKIFLVGFSVFLGSCTHLKKSNPRNPAGTKAPFELSEECQNFINKLPSEFEYGWVNNSENDRRTDLPPVYTFYYHKPVEGQIPVAYFNGGPGQHSHQAAISSSKIIQATLGQALWLVFIDQRGTGCSSRYPKSRPISDYFSWGTHGIVRDADLVRQALGYDQWHIFGQSYGGVIVQRYLEMFPQHVKKAVSHGGATVASIGESSRLRHEQQLHAAKQLMKEYPELIEKIVDIVTQKKCVQGVCGGDFVAMTLGQNMGSRASWPNIKLMLEVAFKSMDIQPLNAPPIFDINGISVIRILSWAESDSPTWANCSKVRSLYLRAFNRPELFALSECWFMGAFDHSSIEKENALTRTLQEVGRPFINLKQIRKNLEVYPQIQFTMFSNEWDYYVPDAIISRAAGQMGPRVHFHRLLKATHFAFIETHIKKIFGTFLEP